MQPRIAGASEVDVFVVDFKVKIVPSTGASELCGTTLTLPLSISIRSPISRGHVGRLTNDYVSMTIGARPPMWAFRFSEGSVGAKLVRSPWRICEPVQDSAAKRRQWHRIRLSRSVGL